MSQSHKNLLHYPALDGLRGLAVLLVVIYHNFGFIDYFFFGWLGVDLFFVLSGFLITGILMKSLGQKNFLRNFYMRRVLRIFPLYYLCLLIFLVILPAFNKLPVNLDYYTENQWWLWTYLQNWLFIIKEAGSTDILHHFWSLAVEEQFYLIWPLTILIVRNPRFLLLIMAIVLLTVILLRYIIWERQIENLAYFNLYTFSRIDGIAIGSMLALLHQIDQGFLKKNTALIVLLLAAANFLFYFINSRNQFGFPYLAIVGYTTFAIMFAILIHEAVSRESRLVNFLFDNKFMRFFGKISYGFYVFHWPVFILLNPVILKWMENNALPYPALLSSLVCTLAGLLISLLSFRYFESWFLKKKVLFQN
ncbi:MAG TPA: acyltransferase [Chitinophagaceae bacterium]|nr:acyltransferase [Chitinophagaceae bacterium]